jgi:hypothetical protein
LARAADFKAWAKAAPVLVSGVVSSIPICPMILPALPPPLSLRICSPPVLSHFSVVNFSV